MCCIKLKEGRKCIPKKDSEIAFLKGAGSYTFFQFTNGDGSRQSNAIGEWETEESIVASEKFLRVHESYMINYENVLHYDSARAVMNDKDKTFVPFSEKYNAVEKLENLLYNKEGAGNSARANSS